MSHRYDAPDPHLDPIVAAGYDVSNADEFEPGYVDAAVNVLAELAGDGDGVEIAIGTGRIASRSQGGG